MPGAVVAAHQLEPELFDPIACERQADQAATVGGHEVDRIRRGHLGRDDQITLVFAVFIIDKHEHAPVARLIDDFLDGYQHGGIVIAEQESIQLGQRVRGRVPLGLGAIAQGVGMEASCAGKAGAGQLSGDDKVTDAVYGLRCHDKSVSHCSVIFKIESTLRCGYLLFPIFPSELKCGDQASNNHANKHRSYRAKPQIAADIEHREVGGINRE